MLQMNPNFMWQTSPSAITKLTLYHREWIIIIIDTEVGDCGEGGCAVVFNKTVQQNRTDASVLISVCKCQEDADNLICCHHIREREVWVTMTEACACIFPVCVICFICIGNFYMKWQSCTNVFLFIHGRICACVFVFPAYLSIYVCVCVCVTILSQI